MCTIASLLEAPGTEVGDCTVILSVGQLTHCGQQIWVNIGSGSGFLLDGAKPFPEPMLTYHQ